MCTISRGMCVYWFLLEGMRWGLDKRREQAWADAGMFAELHPRCTCLRRLLVQKSSEQVQSYCDIRKFPTFDFRISTRNEYCYLTSIQKQNNHFLTMDMFDISWLNLGVSLTRTGSLCYLGPCPAPLRGTISPTARLRRSGLAQLSAINIIGGSATCNDQRMLFELHFYSGFGVSNNKSRGNAPLLQKYPSGMCTPLRSELNQEVAERESTTKPNLVPPSGVSR